MAFKPLPSVMMVLCAAVLSVTACSGLRLLNFITPKTGYTLHSDIAYGDLPRQSLDVYVPDKPVARHDVVLFFYGGSWQTGGKGFYRFVAQNLAARGYVTVIADYRVYPDVYFPAFVKDGAQALVWTHETIRHYRGNPDRLFVTGHSAGAHIAMMLALKDGYIKQAGGKPDWIQATIGIAGPYDFLPFTDPAIKALFSKVPAPETQPIHYVTHRRAPVLLLHGDRDTDVRLKNSDRLAHKLRAAGNDVTYRVYPGVNHVDIILGLAHGFEKRAPTLDDMVSFMQTH